MINVADVKMWSIFSEQNMA